MWNANEEGVKNLVQMFSETKSNNTKKHQEIYEVIKTQKFYFF